MRIKYRKIEFWTASCVFAFIVYKYIEQAQQIMAYHGADSYVDSMTQLFLEHGFRYDYLANSLYPEIALAAAIYLSFIFLNNFAIPRYYPVKDYNRIGLLTLAAFIFTILVFSFADYFKLIYKQKSVSHYFIEAIPRILLLFCIYFLYVLIKKIIEYYLINPDKNHALSARILREFLVAFIVWLAVLLLLVATDNSFLGPLWISVIPYGYFLFLVNLYGLIPGFERSKKKISPYILKLIIVTIVLFIIFYLISLAMTGHRQQSLHIILFIITTFISITLAWFIYLRNKEQIYQLIYLKKELGKATSNLQFLRSQINPHFLFNALNTLYGTALQEKAERTGEGIQKLGDMMRFMLHENMQDKIPISREIQYIKHYVDLQLLRTQASPDIVVETELIDSYCHEYLAPMLLIPFVENAFKHGISLQKKSWVKIAFRCNKGSLDFDVYNSIHHKSTDDPEKDKSGIGLENVKQRLAMLYPEKHELIIRETAQEFFVHLTLKLN